MKRAAPATPSKVAKRRAASTPAPKKTHTPDWAAAGLAHVAKADGGRLKAIIDEHGPPGYLEEDVKEDSACGALCRIVVGQQLAGAAAASPTPRAWVLPWASLPPGALRPCSALLVGLAS